MRALANAEVLVLWEQTRGQNPLRQALQCVACVSPELTREQWGELPVGHVCRALFQLRSLMFGPSMPAIARCPQCTERLEFTFQCEAILPEIANASAMETTLQLQEEQLQLRLPSTNDLLCSASATDLLLRCSTPPVREPLRWLDKASQWIAQADPLAETAIELTCPACQHCWEAPLDIATYLSAELTNLTRRLLRDVHRLASAYGWGEKEILELSAARRSAYLEMAGA